MNRRILSGFAASTFLNIKQNQEAYAVATGTRATVM